MKSNFQKASRRVWALVLSTLMVLTTVTGSVTIPSKVAKAEGGSIIGDSNFTSLASEETDTGWWLYDGQNDGNWANCAADITADGTGLHLNYTANNGGFSDALWGIQIFQKLVESDITGLILADLHAYAIIGNRAIDNVIVMCRNCSLVVAV